VRLAKDFNKDNPHYGQFGLGTKTWEGDAWKIGGGTNWPVATRPKSRNSAMASELIKHVSDASFEADVLQPGSAVLVDYWAEWCGPCKMIAPILDEVAGTYQGKLQIAKMNVDENREIPAKFGIRGIPTLMLFKDGQLAATKVGAMSKAQLTAFIDQQLA